MNPFGESAALLCLMLNQLEWTERDTIQKNKDAEREKTTAELEAWQQRQKALEKEEILNGLQRRPEVPRKKLPCPLGCSE